MLTENIKKRLEDKLYNVLKESLTESDFFGGDFMQYEKKKEPENDKEDDQKDEHHSQLLKLSDYQDN